MPDMQLTRPCRSRNRFDQCLVATNRGSEANGNGLVYNCTNVASKSFKVEMYLADAWKALILQHLHGFLVDLSRR